MSSDQEIAWDVVTLPSGHEVAVSTWENRGVFETVVLLGGHYGTSFFPQVLEEQWNSEISAFVGHEMYVLQLRLGELDLKKERVSGTKDAIRKWDRRYRRNKCKPESGKWLLSASFRHQCGSFEDQPAPDR